MYPFCDDDIILKNQCYSSGGSCQKDSLPRQKSKVFVYIEDETNQTTVILTLDMHQNKVYMYSNHVALHLCGFWF